MNYYNKYLKYKRKYLKMREIMIGGTGSLDYNAPPFKITNILKKNTEIVFEINFGNFYKNTRLLDYLNIFNTSRLEFAKNFNEKERKSVVIGRLKMKNISTSVPLISSAEFTDELPIFIYTTKDNEEKLKKIELNGKFTKIDDSTYKWVLNEEVQKKIELFTQEISTLKDFIKKAKDEYIEENRRVEEEREMEEKKLDNNSYVIKESERSKRNEEKAKIIYDLLQELLNKQLELQKINNTVEIKHELANIQDEVTSALVFYNRKKIVFEINSNKFIVSTLLSVRNNTIKEKGEIYEKSKEHENISFKYEYMSELEDLGNQIIRELIKLKSIIEDKIRSISVSTPDYSKVQEDLRNINFKINDEEKNLTINKFLKFHYFRILSSTTKQEPTSDI